MVVKQGAKLHFTLEETDYYETMRAIYRDILKAVEENIDND